MKMSFGLAAWKEREEKAFGGGEGAEKRGWHLVTGVY